MYCFETEHNRDPFPSRFVPFHSKLQLSGSDVHFRRVENLTSSQYAPSILEIQMFGHQLVSEMFSRNNLTATLQTKMQEV